MPIEKALGFAAAFGWAVSSLFWICSALVKAKSSLPPPNEDQKTGTVMTKGGHYIDGVPQMTTSDIQTYLKSAGRWNKNAGAVSAVSAALTALSLFFAG
jgi:hypothetical protein